MSSTNKCALSYDDLKRLVAKASFDNAVDVGSYGQTWKRQESTKVYLENEGAAFKVVCKWRIVNLHELTRLKNAEKRNDRLLLFAQMAVPVHNKRHT